MHFDIARELGVQRLDELLKLVDEQVVSMTTTTNPHMSKPIIRLRRARGKQLRASLLLAVAHSRGEPPKSQAIDLAAAVELLHLASLVHDDIIDNAPTRRGQETISHKEGPNQAIIIGDFLFAQANFLASSVSAEAGKLLAGVMAELCDGQLREMVDDFNFARTKQAYLNTIAGKTAALSAACCRMGALLAGHNAVTQQAYENFGQHFGMSFQLIDDVLDLVADPKKLGKPNGTDIKEGVYTLPIIMARDELRTVMRGKQLDTVALERIVAVCRQAGSIDKTLKLALARCHSAAAALKAVAPGRKVPLATFPENYCRWAISYFTA